MKREYDFSDAERGKFYKEGAEIRLPIYLDIKLQAKLQRIAEQEGEDVGDVVNRLLAKDVDSIEESR